MPSYRIFEFPTTAPDALNEASNVRAVADQFSWSAFNLALPWIVAKGLWFVLLGYLAALLVVLMIGLTVGLLPAVISLTVLSLFFAVEAKNFEANTLLKNGWKEKAVLIADSEEQAELRYFSKISDVVSDVNRSYLTENAR